jgi:hypothetical protein
MKNLLTSARGLFSLILLSLLLFQCDTDNVSLPPSEDVKAPFVVSSKQATEVAQRYIATLHKQASKPGARANSSTARVFSKVCQVLIC